MRCGRIGSGLGAVRGSATIARRDPFLIAVLAAIDRTVVSTVGSVLEMFNGRWLPTANYGPWLAEQGFIEPVLALTNAKLPPECQAILI